MGRRYHILDVFTDTAFAGNPLAVVQDGDGLDTARMQAIAREFNLSETVFVCEPRDPVNTARLRIFTPGRELPFAGHPTVGAAALIAMLRAPDLLRSQDLRVVVEEGVGDVVCVVSQRKGAPRNVASATFELPRLPQEIATAASREDLAAALSLSPDDIGFDAHVPTVFSAGLGFTFVPLASRAALARARANVAAWGAVAPKDHANAFVYARGGEREGSHFRARMFAPDLGIGEDPATGSAAAAFAGVLMKFEEPPDGEHLAVIEQGFEMGRPSVIRLGLNVEGERLVAATIGGAAVTVMQGTIEA